jgi:hypothetical protein
MNGAPIGETYPSRQPILEMPAPTECYDGEDAAGCDRVLARLDRFCLNSGIDRNLLNACLIESPRWINAGEGTEAPH